MPECAAPEMNLIKDMLDSSHLIVEGDFAKPSIEVIESLFYLESYMIFSSLNSVHRDRRSREGRASGEEF